MSPEEDPIKLWQHIHGASSHFPIALLMMSLLLDLVPFKLIPFYKASAMVENDTPLRQSPLSLASYVLLVAAALGTIPSALSGFAGQLGWFGVTAWQAESLNTHRNVALVAAGTMVLLAVWRTIRKNDLRGAERIAFLIAAFLAVLAVGFTGWQGGYVARGY